MKKRYPFIKAILVLVYIFLFLPIAVVILMSFNASPYGSFPFTFTLEWYEMLFSGGELWSAAGLSVWFSLLVMLAAGVVGTLAALGMRKRRRCMAGVLNNLLNTAIILPWLVLGIAMLLFLNLLGIGRSYVGMFLGNLAVVLPYVVLLVYPALLNLNPNLEYAARTLGAKPWKVFFTVTLPGILPALGAGCLMALVVCFNNFVIQYYLAPFGVRTLPLEIYNLVRVGYKPDMNALAAIIMVVSLGLVGLAYKLGMPVMDGALVQSKKGKQHGKEK